MKPFVHEYIFILTREFLCGEFNLLLNLFNEKILPHRTIGQIGKHIEIIIEQLCEAYVFHDFTLFNSLN